MSRRLKIAIASIIVITVIVLAIVVVYPKPFGWIDEPSMIVIGTSKGSTATNWTWTIMAITAGMQISRSDINIQLKNASGFVINMEPLSAASGTHGFNYLNYTSGDYLSPLDVFSLSKDYAVGSKINLITSHPWPSYPAYLASCAVLTV